MVDKNKINTIMFDVFGTVFDWHKSIVNECSFFAEQNNVTFDHVKFTNDWRSGFKKLQKQVSEGVREYLSMDSIHFEVLRHKVVGFTKVACRHQSYMYRRVYNLG